MLACLIAGLGLLARMRRRVAGVRATVCESVRPRNVPPAPGPVPLVTGAMPLRLSGGLVGWRSGLSCLLGAEPGPDLVGFSRAELGVQGECLLPAAAGLFALPRAMVAFGEFAVDACQLVGVSGLVG
jgi:hypothetical protein